METIHIDMSKFTLALDQIKSDWPSNEQGNLGTS